MKQIEILNQFFKFKGKLGTQFCVAVNSDRNIYKLFIFRYLVALIFSNLPLFPYFSMF